MLTPQLIIFDFDGVVADSEVLANTALAAYLSDLGKPTTLDDSIREFMGKRHEDMLAAVDRWLGRPRHATFSEDYRERSRGVMRDHVQPVDGVVAFMDTMGHLPKCVASSSSRNWLDHCVDKFALRPHLGDNLFSATEVKHGKPAPDIFLLAAARMGVAPSTVVVIEDSPTGVRGAKAAGMTTIGFLGGSHVNAAFGEQLKAAGADVIAEDYAAIARLMAASR